MAQVSGAKTNAVSGDLTAREALDRMVAGTDLEVVQDDKTGALAVKRATGPNAPRAAQSETSDRSGKLAETDHALIKLEPVTVLGTRIRQTDVEHERRRVFDDDRLTGALREAAQHAGFADVRPVVEIRGLCSRCATA